MNKISKRDISFSLLDVQGYLANEKWEMVGSTSTSTVFSGPKTDGGRNIIFRLPSSEENIDFYERVSDLINIFSALKKIDQKEIIRQISLVNHDIFRARILNPGLSNCSISLDVAAIGIPALRNLFLYAASAEVAPRPSFDRPASKGIAYVNQCQFGHTFEGSFGFTITSPINLQSQKFIQQNLFDNNTETEKTFERRVTERIIHGLMSVNMALEQKNADIIVENFEYGFNSKMCESFLEFSAEKSKNVEFSIDWSPRLKPSEKVERFRAITLQEPELEIIEEAVRKFKNVKPYQDIITGHIVTLHSAKEPFSNEDFLRTATIKHHIDEKTVNVKLELDKAGYEIAYKAHGQGKTICVTGELFKSGATWRMTNILEIKELYS